MPLPVKLADVVEQLSIGSDDISVYLNKGTGEFVVVSAEEMLGFEDEDDFADAADQADPDWSEDQPEWLKQEQRTLREVFNSDDFVALPDKFDIHDWQIMEDFCHSVKRARVREQLLGLIRGRGAFGRFHSAIRSMGIENDWYQFRHQAYERIAIEWLEENEIEFIADCQIPIAHSAAAGMRNVTQTRSSGKITAAHRNIHKQNQTVGEATARGNTRNAAEVGEIKVFISNRNSHCGECDQDLGTKAWITLEQEKGAVCLSCADLDELVFLPSGDAALTRRSKKYSNLSAIVLKFSKARGRYERQGLLVEESALEQAEAECLADSEVRERHNERARERRAELDEQYVEEFGRRIRALFPNCPAGREQSIAEHACLKYSGRVGRSAAAKDFDDEMITLAVMAHVRHRETNYDSLLDKGWFRNEARAQVRDRVEAVMEKWRES
jgi:hypothetical protein